MANTEFEQLEKMLRRRRKPLATAERRLAYDELGTLFPTADDVEREFVRIGEASAEWTTTKEAREDSAILYLHGGGYVYGSLESHRHLASELGRSAGARTLALDYRRAPEAPFPAALDDAVAAWRYLLDKGHRPDRLAIAGDSAGGGLAVAMMVQLRELSLPQPMCGILFSPWVDMHAAGPSYDANAARDPVVGRDIITFCALQYLGEGNGDNPMTSPVRANLRGIAPLTIFAGAGETLLDDSIQLARAAGLADVQVRLEIWPDVVHIWPTYHQIFSPGRKALLQAGRVIRDAMVGSSVGH